MTRLTSGDDHLIHLARVYADVAGGHTPCIKRDDQIVEACVRSAVRKPEAANIE